MKGTFLEGGIRIPFVVQWPAKLPKGKTYDFPVSSLDILPSSVESAGGKMPDSIKYDGVNIFPFLLGEAEGKPHETLYWRRAACAAIRFQNWKLIRFPDRPAYLFNLKDDIGENNNLADDTC